MMAHVGGVPLEEVLPALPGAGALLWLVRAWLYGLLVMLPGRSITPAARQARSVTHR